MTKRQVQWPPREDRRVRRERTVTDANRVNTYGLPETTQKRLRTLILGVIASEPLHADGEVRFRHIGANIAEKLVSLAVGGDGEAANIIEGVVATELRRHAQRIHRDEYEQAAEPRQRPEQPSLLS